MAGDFGRPSLDLPFSLGGFRVARHLLRLLSIRRTSCHISGGRQESVSYTCSYCSFAYSVFACFRMGRSGSASLQRVRKSW